MLAQAILDGQEDDTLLLEVLQDGVIDHLGFILRAHAGQELPLGFGDAQFIEGVLDGIRDIVPGTFEPSVGLT